LVEQIQCYGNLYNVKRNIHSVLKYRTVYLILTADKINVFKRMCKIFLFIIIFSIVELNYIEE